jgi:hypothetical protein
MAETPPMSRWPARRVAALVLTLALVAVGGWSVANGIIGTLPVLLIGIALGVTYVVRGGSLPQWVYWMGKSRYGVRRITPDDDPSNLPWRVYLPVLLGMLLLAALVFYLGMR